jgi:hypothetical protein
MQTHNPQRFAVFEESADGRGFFIPTGEYFLFDEHGGWYDEAKNYYDKNGAPAMPPAQPQGKNRGFNTQVYDNQRSYRNDYQGARQPRSDRPYNQDRKKPYGGRNNRRQNDDIDDDPVLAEFGGDDYDDDRFTKRNREEEERLERAYRLESSLSSPEKREALDTYLIERINKDAINLLVDLSSLGKADFTGKDFEQLLASKGFTGVKVEEKKHNRSDLKTFKLSLVDRQQAWSILSLEGTVASPEQTTATFKVSSIEVPVASKVYSDYGDDSSEREDGDEESGDDEDGDSEDSQDSRDADIEGSDQPQPTGASDK